MKKILAIILAGGRGQRMGILCHERSKPIMPFGPGYRVIDFTLSNCINSSIDDVIVAVDYQRRITTDYVTKWSDTNSKHSELTILEPLNGGYKGTADAIYQNLDYILKSQPDDVLILAGDHIYQMDYRELLDFHAYFKGDVTIGTRTVPIDQASRFGVAHVNNHNRIVDFVEKPDVPPSNLVSMGIYAFKTSVLLEQLKRDGIQKLSAHDFGHNIIPSMVKDSSRVLSYTYDGYWCDIGTVESYFSANMDYLNGKFPSEPYGKWPVLTCNSNFVQMPFSPDGRVNNSLVSTTSTIEGRVTNSIISDNAHIGKNATVNNSLVLSNTDIGDFSMVDYCVLDEDVVIDRVCHIGKPDMASKPCITVLGKGARVSRHDSVSMNYDKSRYLGVGYYSNLPLVPDHVVARQVRLRQREPICNLRSSKHG
jgi:glucose-1-phosphate adenylyltransferase